MGGAAGVFSVVLLSNRDASVLTCRPITAPLAGRRAVSDPLKQTARQPLARSLCLLVDRQPAIAIAIAISNSGEAKLTALGAALCGAELARAVDAMKNRTDFSGHNRALDRV